MKLKELNEMLDRKSGIFIEGEEKCDWRLHYRCIGDDSVELAKLTAACCEFAVRLPSVGAHGRVFSGKDGLYVDIQGVPVECRELIRELLAESLKIRSETWVMIGVLADRVEMQGL